MCSVNALRVHTFCHNALLSLTNREGLKETLKITVNIVVYFLYFCIFTVSKFEAHISEYVLPL